MRYTLDLIPDDNDTYLVTCLELPEVTSFGNNPDDAVRHGVAAIGEALAARIAANKPSADVEERHARGVPFEVSLPALTKLKVALYDELRKQGISRAELCRRLDWNRESVDRLFRLNHASRLEQIEAAAGVLGCVLEVNLVNQHRSAQWVIDTSLLPAGGFFGARTDPLIGPCTYGTLYVGSSGDSPFSLIDAVTNVGHGDTHRLNIVWTKHPGARAVCSHAQVVTGFGGTTQGYRPSPGVFTGQKRIMSGS